MLTSLANLNNSIRFWKFFALVVSVNGVIGMLIWKQVASIYEDRCEMYEKVFAFMFEKMERGETELTELDLIWLKDMGLNIVEDAQNG